MSTTNFTEQLWARSAATYAEILDHPFLTGLTDGSLDRDAFCYFVVQDSHYLRNYARALSLVSARASTPRAVRMFALHCANAVAVEESLHAGLLRELGLPDTDLAVGPGPTTTAYTSYLLAVCATSSYAEALATVLPCYWYYRDVGRALLQRSSPVALYATWIATYGGPEFDAVVREVLAETDAIGEHLGPTERERCGQHFAMTARYEWMFFDAAYRRLSWPI